MGFDGFADSTTLLGCKIEVEIDISRGVEQDDFLVVDQAVAARTFTGTDELVELVTGIGVEKFRNQQVAPGFDAAGQITNIGKPMFFENLGDEFGRTFLGTDDADAGRFFRHLVDALILYLHEIEIGYVEHFNGMGTFNFESAKILFIAHIQQYELVFVDDPLVEFAGTIRKDCHG